VEAALKILLVAGARPNFPKIAPIAAELRRHPNDFEALVVHTGQHYDYQLSEIFFEELELGPPDYFLDARKDGSGPQMADILFKFDALLGETRPDLVVVVGDVSSTVICSLAASTRGIAVAHVEAGLRSGDRRMPEEINRIATDGISDALFTFSANADANLAAENVPASCVHRIGNVMIDTLHRFRDKARACDVLERHDLSPQQYVLVTMHRRSNLDDENVLAGLVDALARIAEETDVLFPVHPHTRKRLEETGLNARLAAPPRMRLVEPVGYVDMLRLQQDARLALTDSAGIQEETTVLGVPCLTMRLNTERPETITEGTNQLVGVDPDHIVAETQRVLRDGVPAGRIPELWDGHSAERLVAVLRDGILLR
jgi:UDP-N-acetylglucosamine 2-epimerase (non-hydrolysing)